MKKIPTLSLITLIASLIGGVYGILHDQLTYSISPEYYTKLKFYQFGLIDVGNEAIVPNPRLYVSVVGFLASWWMGLFIGLILGLVGLIHPEPKQMLRVTLRAMIITISIAFATGLIGLALGEYQMEKINPDWLPDNVFDKKNFLAVGTMHNFSYLGGVTGLIAGALYSIWQHKRHKRKKNADSRKID